MSAIPSLARRARSLDRAVLAEVFAAANLAFLVLDITLAHAYNDFRNPAEWIPLAYSILGAFALAVGLLLRSPLDRGVGRAIGWAVGLAGVLVGVAGMLWHLSSQFFELRTLSSLVYSAPFVAPLAFTGIGLLVLMNRLVPHDAVEWGAWVTLLALGGLGGDFVLALVDHAQNGFFNGLEWLAVGAAAFGVAFVGLALMIRPSPGFYAATMAVLGLEIVVGGLGFVLHTLAVLGPSVVPLPRRVLYGPPLFAPLLFPNLSLLAALGLWDMRVKGWTNEAADTHGADGLAPSPAAE